MDPNGIYLFFDKKEQVWIVMGKNFRLTFKDPKEAYNALVTITEETPVLQYIKNALRED